MPLITVLYTPDLDGLLDVGRLVDVLHETALGLDCFPPYGIRTMASRAEASRIGDSPGRAYVQVNVRSAPGRSDDAKEHIVGSLFAALTAELSKVSHPALRYQLELSEFDTRTTRAGGAE
ncbi:hypothetical protein ABZ725_37560 [Streptomyces sp. NPDC006872]|uniref:hypothetical protein n=1 Tax=Streptomyces sp. NPDC006872 TaxID=3155720 RepID=UPI0033C48A53